MLRHLFPMEYIGLCHTTALYEQHYLIIYKMLILTSGNTTFRRLLWQLKCNGCKKLNRQIKKKKKKLNHSSVQCRPLGKTRALESHSAFKCHGQVNIFSPNSVLCESLVYTPSISQHCLYRRQQKPNPKQTKSHIKTWKADCCSGKIFFPLPSKPPPFTLYIRLKDNSCLKCESSLGRKVTTQS